MWKLTCAHFEPGLPWFPNNPGHGISVIGHQGRFLEPTLRGPPKKHSVPGSVADLQSDITAGLSSQRPVRGDFCRGGAAGALGGISSFPGATSALSFER